jgi:hypothetical protein
MRGIDTEGLYVSCALAGKGILAWPRAARLASRLYSMPWISRSHTFADKSQASGWATVGSGAARGVGGGAADALVAPAFEHHQSLLWARARAV